MHFNLLYSFFLHVSDIFRDFFVLFLSQNFKTKVLTAHKKNTFRMSVLGIANYIVVVTGFCNICATLTYVFVLLELLLLLGCSAARQSILLV